jgi:hypothetical protein
MNKLPDINPSPRRFWSYCLAYLAWFTAIAISGYLFLLFHTVFTKWYIALGLRHSAYRASSQLFMIVGGIVWLVFIFFTDDYLKSGIEKRTLNHRLVLVFSALLLLALLAGASSLLTRPLLGVTS